MMKDIYRIIDANLNRSREGLRVCEDVARFILNSPILTKEFKSIRHKISNVAKALSSKSNLLSESRDVEDDVGKYMKLKNRTSTSSSKDVLLANIERVKESLRVLEEFFKLIDKKNSSKFTYMRFKVYDVEKRTVKRLASLRHLG